MRDSGIEDAARLSPGQSERLARKFDAINDRLTYRRMDRHETAAMVTHAAVRNSIAATARIS